MFIFHESGTAVWLLTSKTGRGMLVAPTPTAKTGVFVLPTKVTDNGFRSGKTPSQGAARFRQNHNNAQPAMNRAETTAILLRFAHCQTEYASKRRLAQAFCKRRPLSHPVSWLTAPGRSSVTADSW
jgi:hypothetical protein